VHPSADKAAETIFEYLVDEGILAAPALVDPRAKD
jgi:hypothetical protein